MTREPITLADIRPNERLRQAISAFREEYPFAEDLEIDREDLLAADL